MCYIKCPSNAHTLQSLTLYFELASFRPELLRWMHVVIQFCFCFSATCLSVEYVHEDTIMILVNQQQTVIFVILNTKM